MISFNMSGLTDTEVADLIKNRSGWGVYRDSIHTSASPQTISQGTTSILTNNANTSIITELPNSQSVYDGVNNKFLPLSLNDYYIWIVRFKAKNSQGNGGYFDLGIDIGGTFGTIFTESHIFIRGANVEQTFSCMMGGYTGSTFMANGGIPKVTSGVGNTSIYDKEYHIIRLYQGS